MAEGGWFGQSIDIGSDVLYDFSCTPCANNNINEEAGSYCVECREYLCVSCLKHHNKFAIMRNHQILDKAAMSAQGPQQTPTVLTEKCQVHHGNTIDTYCPVHQSVGCGTCIALKHGSCKGVAYIPNVAQGFKKSEEYKNIKPAIKSSIQELKTFKTAIQTDLTDLHKEKDVTLKKIKDYRKSIEMKLDRMEKKITDEVHTKYKILQAEVNANMKSIEDMMSKLQSNLTRLESKNADNEAGIFIYVKDGNTNITESYELLQNLNAISQRGILQFKQNLAFDECMTKNTMLGELHEEINRRPYNVYYKTKKNRLYSQNGKQMGSALLTGKYNVKMKTDTIVCDITGSTFLDDGKLLITDCENKKLKRLNNSFQVTDYCDLPDRPYGLCVTDNKEVVVALPWENKVQFVTVRNTLKLSRSFSTIGKCTGLAYSNKNIIAANHMSEYVHIYSENGKCLKTITVNISDLNSKYFSYTCIALNTDHSKLIFSNHNNGIISVSIKDGHIDWVCTEQMSAVLGLCVLDNDNILVADYVCNEIFQITSDGHMLGAVVQEKFGIEKPVSLCVDKATSRLIVTSANDNIIKAFNLKIQ